MKKPKCSSCYSVTIVTSKKKTSILLKAKSYEPALRVASEAASWYHITRNTGDSASG